MFVCNFLKKCSSYIILRILSIEGNSVDLDEVAHVHPDLSCLQIQLLSSLILKELSSINTDHCNERFSKYTVVKIVIITDLR